MAKYFSPSVCAFYADDVHANAAIPSDVREISDEEWQQLLNEQASGKQIVAGTHGGPVSVERRLSAEDVLVRRDISLAGSDWLVARHRDEIEIDPSHTTLTGNQYAALQQWRRLLRDISSHPEFPNVVIPDSPV